MHPAVETLLVVAAASPGLYGASCWMRRVFNAHRAAKWAREHHSAAWDSIHWLARRNRWAAVEVLVSKGLISGPEVDEFRRRDEHLEKATWIGLLISGGLLVVIGVLKLVAEKLI